MRIAVVIVTFNRLEKLKTTLRLFDEQIDYPDSVVVVNNASTDGTAAFLSHWKLEHAVYDKHILTLLDNMGGSGGFYEGLKYAIDSGADWIWVSDDDAFPDKNAIHEAKHNIDLLNAENISALCGVVFNNGLIDCTHRRRIKLGLLKVHEENSCVDDYNQKWFDIDLFSYVGTIISAEKLKQVGITLKDYFIFCDDAEHSMRLRQAGRIVCVPSIIVYHNVANDNLISWKSYYGERNRLDMYRRHMPRRYYYYNIVIGIVRVVYYFVIRKNKDIAKMKLVAICDAINRKTGKNEVYKPGWKPQ